MHRLKTVLTFRNWNDWIPQRNQCITIRLKDDRNETKEFVMQLFKRILAPVDLSEVSSKIAPYVSELAARLDAEIHLLFVARVFEYYTNIYVIHPAIKNFEAEIAKGAKKKLKEFVDTHFKERPPKVKIVSGDPAEEILNYAESEKMDLIIIGTHGRKSIGQVVFGSIAERIVQKSPVPVLTVNPYSKTLKEPVREVNGNGLAP